MRTLRLERAEWVTCPRPHTAPVQIHVSSDAKDFPLCPHWIPSLIRRDLESRDWFSSLYLTISRGPWHCADRLSRRTTGNPLSLFRHSPPTDPEVASHRFLGTANTVWTPAKTGDVFWVTLCKHIYTICLWHWQVDTMIHYSYCMLNIDSWKILSPGESQGTGHCAQGEGSGNLFLGFYSLSNKILIMMKMCLKVFHTMD